jgi:hypothetical protein
MHPKAAYGYLRRNAPGGLKRGLGEGRKQWQRCAPPKLKHLSRNNVTGQRLESGGRFNFNIGQQTKLATYQRSRPQRWQGLTVKRRMMPEPRIKLRQIDIVRITYPTSAIRRPHQRFIMDQPG